MSSLDALSPAQRLDLAHCQPPEHLSPALIGAILRDYTALRYELADVIAGHRTYAAEPDPDHCVERAMDSEVTATALTRLLQGHTPTLDYLQDAA